MKSLRVFTTRLKNAAPCWKNKHSHEEDKVSEKDAVPYMLFTMVFVNIFFFSMQQTMVFSFLPKWIKSMGVGEVEGVLSCLFNLTLNSTTQENLIKAVGRGSSSFVRFQPAFI